MMTGMNLTRGRKEIPMRADKIVAAGLLLAAAVISTQTIAVGQRQAPPSRPASLAKAFVTPGDPELLTPEMLTGDVDSRLFVDSFLVSLFTMDTGKVYDAYLHPEMIVALDRESLEQQVAELKDAVGPLARVVLSYLREENRAFDGMDGGWTENTLIFAGDPKVYARVDFRRVADGRWKVIEFEIKSPELARLQQAQAAARKAAEGAAKASPEGGGDEPQSPDSLP